MYEKRTETLIKRKQFYIRLLKHFLGILILIIFSLLIGIFGFMAFEGLTLSESFLHSSIMLSGLGLLEKPSTHNGHFFAGIYGLYSGLIFIASFGILISPVIHRIIHKFHWNENE
ncbi:hypothetical protein [Flavivirga sp. 57AJ16]|uniref:hypothetical protein n=1 Tax=Flavivirga sp. 57AJ16 TaxID=3025307 RepID=UPI002366F202|nr:hypothetical protein [Flavivirga sp. 57AJ16]MDD7886525.1 hypothetical protein [Flavivirga sp. 57AJ16]